MRGAILGAGGDGWRTSPDTGGTPSAGTLAQRQQAGLAALAALRVPEYPAWVPDGARGDYGPPAGDGPPRPRHRLAYGLLMHLLGQRLAATLRLRKTTHRV